MVSISGLGKFHMPCSTAKKRAASHVKDEPSKHLINEVLINVSCCYDKISELYSVEHI